MLINRNIPNLFNGVSQQPAPLRHSSQCEVSENAYPTVSMGLSKRPNTVHLSKLRDTFTTGVFTHVINRDTTERYAVFVTNGNIEVFDLLTGIQKTVTTPDGVGYLTSLDPKADFSLTTIADYTFVLNKSKTVAMGTSTPPVNPINVSYVNVVASPQLHTFSITVGGVTGSASLGSAGSTIGALADSLRTDLATALGASYTVTRFASGGIKIVRNNGTAIVTSVSDTYGNEAIKLLSKGSPRFSSLPSTFDTGYAIKITGDPDNDEDEYYVEYKDGGWVETVAPGTVNDFDNSTMPHILIRNSDGTFKFSKSTLEPRKTGDDNSNPLPSFVGGKISDIFFFRNRMGFLADENVILSVAGAYFDFFAETARTVLDSDPIDISAPGTKISILKYAIPFNKVLLLFSPQGQFQLSCGDILTTKTARIDASTSFEISTLARPVAAGAELYFPVDRGGSTGIREYFVDYNDVSNDAVDITAHVPHYLPSGIFKLASSSNEDVVLGISSVEPNVMYVYKYYWAKDEKLQSAWQKFRFKEGDELLGVEFIANYLYLIIKRADGVYLESMNFQPSLHDSGMGYRVLLDRRVRLTGSYNSTTKETTWTMPYAASSDLRVTLGSSFTGQKGYVLPVTVTGGVSIKAAGDYSNGEVFIGIPYQFRYVFSEQYAQDDKGNTLLSAKLKLKRVLLNYSESGYFRVNVTPFARDTYTYIFSGIKLGDATAIIGKSNIASGTFRFPVSTSNIGVTIEIINDSHLPSTFQSAEWEGEMVVNSQRN